MAADMSVYFDFGGSDTAPGTEQDTDALGPPRMRFKTADDATIDLVNPIPIPAAGTKYSYWKQIYLYATGAPATQVDNVKFYSDAGYEIATGTPGDTGDEMVAAHASLTGSTEVFGNYTSGAPKDVTISESGQIIVDIGDTSDYVILQMEVISTASPGTLSSETLTFRYDEI